MKPTELLFITVDRFRSVLPTLVLACLLQLAAASSRGQEGVNVADWGRNVYSQACGPTACFVALQSLGVPTTMTSVLAMCDWQDGETMTLNEILTVLKQVKHIRTLPARMSPEELLILLSRNDAVAILEVRQRSKDINHAVCAVSAQDHRIVLVDYPDPSMEVTPDQLAKIWDGAALVIYPTFNYQMRGKLVWLILPVTAIILWIADLLPVRLRRIWHQ